MSRRRERGFTMVETLIALAVGAFVIAGMYQAFNTLHKWWISAGITSDQRQNARVGIETVTRDLEMAGYQTTNYGDPNKTGIAITFASANEIEMDQQRPDNSTITSADPVYEPRLVYYHLATDMKSGRQHLYRQIRTQPGVPSPDEIVTENVSTFALAYFEQDNTPVAGLPPANPGGSAAYIPGVAVPGTSPLRAIRRIQVTLTTIPARPMPFGPAGRGFTLTASVLPQNLGATDEVTAENDPPAVPAGLCVVDTRTCRAKLRVSWSPNTEPDLAGYLLFFGPTGTVTIPVRGLADKANPEVTLNPAALLITRNADRATAPNTYAIQVAAYDSSGNTSARSTAVSGDPSPDVTACGGANDTTVNPLKPSAPSGVSVALGAAAGELAISWQAPVDGSATVGYRLYRSTTAFAAGAQIAPAPPTVVLLADETTLTADTTSFTDTGADLPDGKLKSCDGVIVPATSYYYAVASVNCDETLVASYRHNEATPSLGDYAVGSGTPTMDSVYEELGPDGTPCPSPSLAGSLPDYLRAFVTLETPLVTACPDFDKTEIHWSKAPSAPPDRTAGVVSGGTLVPDSDIGDVGTFRGRGNQVIVFDSETEEAPISPSLTAGATYNLLAVSYDRCGNPSPPDIKSLASLAILTPVCVDDPPGPPSDSFSNAQFSSCQKESVKISWDYPVPDPPGDFAGFHVERTNPDGTTVELTAGPTLLKSWVDAGPLQPGATYYYAVKAADCTYEADPIANAGNATPQVTIGPVHLGRLQRYQPLSDTGHELDAANFVTTVSDQPASYTHHNNVHLYLQNTSLSLKTIKRMAVTWDNPNVVLDSVVIGGSPSGTTARTFSSLAATSGATFPVDAEIVDVASGTAADQASDPVPVLLRFVTPSGTVNRLTDMRNETLGLSLWILDNPQPDGLVCVSPDKFVIDVPRGPVLGGFSQSAPGIYGIDSYPVVGPSGTARDTDVKIRYGFPINVFGTAFDHSRELFADGLNRGFATLKLVGIDAAPADPAAVPVMPASGSFFERPLYNVGGDRYAIYRTAPAPNGAGMPQESGSVIWYYALAVDRTGNWDRAPNPDTGAFAYYQPPFDRCLATPRAPELTLAATPTAASLTWIAPSAYDDGLPIIPEDALTFDVYTKGAGGDPWPSAPLAANLTGLSFTHTADLLAGTYYYMVRASNSCATGPRPSGDSNVVMECEGPSAMDCSLLRVPATARYGEPIALEVSDFCAYQGNGDTDSVLFRVQSGTTTTDFTVPETGDGGSFAKNITAVWSGGGGDAVAAPSGTLTVGLVVGGTSPCAPKTVTLTGAACFTTPNPPTTFSAARGATGSAAAVLTWVRPNYNTDGTPLTDLGGYEFGTARCAVYNSGTGNCTTWSSWTVSTLNIPTAEAHTVSGLVIGERYKFRMRAKDSCATPNSSAWTSESSVVRVR